LTGLSFGKQDEMLYIL